VSGSKKEECNCTGEKVNALTQKPQLMDRPLEKRKTLPRLIAKNILAASLTCGVIAGTGINSLAQTSQPDYKQQPTPPTKSLQIERRRIGPVFLAVNGLAGLGV
jgi:hypothetical protein